MNKINSQFGKVKFCFYNSSFWPILIALETLFVNLGLLLLIQKITILLFALSIFLLVFSIYKFLYQYQSSICKNIDDKEYPLPCLINAEKTDSEDILNKTNTKPVFNNIQICPKLSSENNLKIEISRQKCINLGIVMFLITEFIVFCTILFNYFYFSIYTEADAKYFLQIMPNDAITSKEVINFSLSQYIDISDWPIINTIILLLSSCSITWGLEAYKNYLFGDRSNYKEVCISLLTTIGLGLLFLIIQFDQYQTLEFKLIDNCYSGIFYFITILHIIHLLLGILVLTDFIIWFAFHSNIQIYNQGIQKYKTLKLVCWYWHFVDFIWILIFVSLYLIPKINF